MKEVKYMYSNSQGAEGTGLPAEPHTVQGYGLDQRLTSAVTVNLP